MEDNTTNQNQFGMTEQDVKQAERGEIWRRVKSIFAQIEPVVIKIFSAFIYYSLRFIKAFVSASMRMILGKEA
jgi:hypothetical protein